MRPYLCTVSNCSSDLQEEIAYLVICILFISIVDFLDEAVERTLEKALAGKIFLNEPTGKLWIRKIRKNGNTAVYCGLDVWLLFYIYKIRVNIGRKDEFEKLDLWRA